MQKTRLLGLIGIVTVAATGATVPAQALPSNEGPPSGWIYDLAGQSIPHGLPLAAYSTDFTASLANTSVSFAFREDPAFILFSGVTVTDLTTGSVTNLITNGDFNGGTYSTAINSTVPNDWTFQNAFGATFQGTVSNSGACGSASGFCWYDGSVQAYDAISQTIATTIGDTYRVAFNLTDNGSLTTFQQLSTNGNVTGTGGNGVDVLVYAQASAVQPGVPELSTWAMLGIGFAGLAFVGQRARRAAVSIV